MQQNSALDREALWLADYAMHSRDSAGREHLEMPHPYRGPFQRDRDRIVHSSAYRRLAYKTQVFTGSKGDYHRTRLTHTLEVASIARTVGRTLRLNEDLIEALALLHDVGHPPFGHAGETVLDHCMHDYGGFSHNSHALRLVTTLETRYPNFPGLNLSREVLAGQQARSAKQFASQNRQSLLEIQVVDAADSIAYDSHDVDDSLELGLLDSEQLLKIPLWRDAADRVHRRYTALDDEQFRRAVIHQLIEILVSDLVETTRARLEAGQITTRQDVEECGYVLVDPSDEIAEQKLQLEDFLFEQVYRHPVVLAERSIAGEALEEMFQRFRSDPESMPAFFVCRLESDGVPRTVCDYLAGMTDRHALEEHRRHVSSSA